MKKMLFAAAAMMAAMTANAVVYDFTGTAAYSGNVSETNASYKLVYCNGGTAYTDGGDATVAGLKLYAKNSDAAKEGFRFNYTDKKDGQHGLVGNSGDLCVELDLKAGDVVSVQYDLKGTSAANFLNTGKSTPLGKGSELGAAAFNLTADAGNVGSTGKGDIVVEKFTANATGKAYLYAVNADILKISVNEDIATAANDAEADAEFAYSVKINGQKVNAKVYNEPVIEVSSNGSAKVVINKK